MAQTYTREDFEKALQQSGLAEQFSQADMQNALRNPDFGMSMLGYKTDYMNATTPEARALANQGAEELRSSLFGYTGGGDGGSFKLDPLSPRNFSYDEAPTFTDNWEGRISDALAKTQNRDPYSYSGVAPTYESRYDPQIQQSIQGILNRGEFSYDPKTDPVYSAYQKQYAREGQRATANAMGEAAAMTGGMPSSWAMTAASQAGDYYGAQMADKIPELYQDAYNRYLQEYQMKLSDLNALRGLESDDYQKYQTELSQFNKDRDFDYAAWRDSIQLDQNDIDNLRALRSDDMDLYKTQLGQYNTDRTFNYSQLYDEISNQRTRAQDEWSQAETAAKYGDYSRLNAKGVDTSSAEYADMVARGVQAAQFGDYSLLNQAGIDTSTAQFKEQLAIAQERAAVGDYSGYAALGVDTSNAQLMDALNIQAKQAQIASTYANMPTEEERALGLEYKRAQIASAYAGLPTAEEKELERRYKEAQIAKMLNPDSGSGSTGSGTGGGTKANPTNGILSDEEWEYFNSLTPNGKSSYAKYANSQGDPRYNTVIGINPGSGGAGASGAAGTVTLDNLGQYLEGIRNAKIAGDKEVRTREEALGLIEALPGYDEETMGTEVKKFLTRLYATPRSGSKVTISGE